MNRKGQIGLVDNFTNIFLFILVIVGIIGVIVGIALFAPIFVGNSLQLNTEINNQLVDVLPSDIDSQNATGIAHDTVQGTLGTIQFIMYAIFIGLILGYLIICFYIRSYPFLIFAWVFVMIFIVVISMFISNAYISSADNVVNADFYSAWGTNDFMMRYLPHLMATLGVIGGIFLLAIYPRDDAVGEAVL